MIRKTGLHFVKRWPSQSKVLHCLHFNVKVPRRCSKLDVLMNVMKLMKPLSLLRFNFLTNDHVGFILAGGTIFIEAFSGLEFLLAV